MSEIQIKLPDGEIKSFPKGTTIGEIFRSLGIRDSVIGAKVNGRLVDFWFELGSDSAIEPVTLNSTSGLDLIRHTAAHIMAEAVQSIFNKGNEKIKVTIGPVIENGFYYDFDYSKGFVPEDLERIEERMKQIIEENKPLIRKKVSREEAIKIFERDGETYKVEIISELPLDEQINIYQQGDWYDLCRGPHAPSTGFVKAFKLLSIAGAYWRGDERNPMLQRIYGTAFWNRNDLDDYLTKLEEAKKRDHRRLGRELDLFSIQDEIGPGLVLWHPKGARIRRVIEDFWRYERSGVIHGLLRVRGFSQDDAHIFCTPNQIEKEVLSVLDLTVFFLRTFGFDDYEVYLSTRPEKFVGSVENWESATEALRGALKAKGLNYETDEGGGAFYGPKIDLKIKDVLGRAWQCSTIQVDFNLPERFNINFVGDDNSRHPPIMIHRAILGSFERFFGILIEHYGGAFPLWLSPIQVRVATIGEGQISYAQDVYETLRKHNLRVEKDFRNEKLGLKVREAQLEKIPYLLVIGEKEVDNKTVAPRKRGGKNLPSMKTEDFLNFIEKENDPYTWREVE